VVRQLVCLLSHHLEQAADVTTMAADLGSAVEAALDAQIYRYSSCSVRKVLLLSVRNSKIIFLH
jgi:hypothetical protein